MKKIILTLYIATLHIALIALATNINLLEKVNNKLFKNEFSSEVTFSPFYIRTLKQHLTMDTQHPEGVDLYIGDSFIQGLSTAAISSPSVNYGISADTTYGLINRLRQYKSIGISSNIIIYIGINDILLGLDDQSILNNYKIIFEILSEHESILISSIFPVSRNFNHNKSLNNRIKLLNNEIESMTNKYENIKYIKISDDLYLNEEYYSEDGLHFNNNGYDAWINTLINHMHSQI